MLFAQLLYIQFYNDQEYVRGEKFWDDAKFAELLAQVNYHAVPDADMITDGKEGLVYFLLRFICIDKNFYIYTTKWFLTSKNCRTRLFRQLSLVVR